MQGKQLLRGSALSSCFTKKEEFRQDLPGSIEVAKNMFKAFYGVRSAKPPEQKRIGLDVLQRALAAAMICVPAPARTLAVITVAKAQVTKPCAVSLKKAFALVHVFPPVAKSSAMSAFTVAIRG